PTTTIMTLNNARFTLNNAARNCPKSFNLSPNTYLLQTVRHTVRGKRRVASMTVNIPGSSVAELRLGVSELQLDRLIEEIRFLQSRTIALHTRLRGIDAYLKASEPSKRRPESKSNPDEIGATSIFISAESVWRSGIGC